MAAGSLGVPDLGISNLDDVLTDVRRITDACDLPLLVDVDTGFGASAFNVARTVKSLIKFGAAAMHIEDQVGAKRCGHRPGKELVSQGGDGRSHQGRGRREDRPGLLHHRAHRRARRRRLRPMLERASACVEAGADGDLPRGHHRPRHVPQGRGRGEGPGARQHHRIRQDAALHARRAAQGAGIAIALYPLSAFRAANQAALEVYETLRRTGSQQGVVGSMQTRDDLYKFLGYHDYEQKLDALFEKAK